MLAVADQNGDGIVQLNEFFMRPDIVVLATPEIAGLPYVISGLVAAGGLAAAMSTADGLLLAIANALSHDLYYKMIDPKADTRRRLTVARVLLLFIGAPAALVASLKLTGILGAVAWAFDFACSGLFFPLVLGVWWKRANTAGAIAGMVGGFVAGSLYLYLVFNKIMTPWFGIDDVRFGIVGMAGQPGLPWSSSRLMTRDAVQGNPGHGGRGPHPDRQDHPCHRPLRTLSNKERAGPGPALFLGGDRLEDLIFIHPLWVIVDRLRARRDHVDADRAGGDGHVPARRIPTSSSCASSSGRRTR